MAHKVGRGTVAAHGEESTWGTEVARTSASRVYSIEVGREFGHEPIPHLIGGSANAGLLRAEVFEASERFRAKVRGPAYYENGALGLLLKHALGSLTMSGAGPYASSIVLSATRQTGLSSEFALGDSGKSQEAYGGKITKLRITCEPGKPAEYEIEVIYKNGAARANTGTIPTIGTSYPILHKHCGQIGFNSVSYTPRRITLEIDIPHTEIQELGSSRVSEPVPADYVSISLEAELVWDGTSTLEEAKAALTESDCTLTFTDSVNSKTFAITLQNAYVSDYSMPIGGPAEVVQTVKWRPKAASSESGITCALTGVSEATGLL